LVKTRPQEGQSPDQPVVCRTDAQRRAGVDGHAPLHHVHQRDGALGLAAGIAIDVVDGSEGLRERQLGVPRP
jgi:hypothetical protein